MIQEMIDGTMDSMGDDVNVGDNQEVYKKVKY